MNKNRHGHVQKKSVFTSEFSTLPFPHLMWDSLVPLGGARVQHKYQYKIKKEQLSKIKERQLGH